MTTSASECDVKVNKTNDCDKFNGQDHKNVFLIKNINWYRWRNFTHNGQKKLYKIVKKSYYIFVSHVKKVGDAKNSIPTLDWWVKDNEVSISSYKVQTSTCLAYKNWKSFVSHQL